MIRCVSVVRVLVDHHLAGDHRLLAGHRLLAPHRDADGALLEGPRQVGLAWPGRSATSRCSTWTSSRSSSTGTVCCSVSTVLRISTAPSSAGRFSTSRRSSRTGTRTWPSASTTCSRAAPAVPAAARPRSVVAVAGAHLPGQEDPVALDAVDGGERVPLPVGRERVGVQPLDPAQMQPLPAEDPHALTELGAVDRVHVGVPRVRHVVLLPAGATRAPAGSCGPATDRRRGLRESAQDRGHGRRPAGTGAGTSRRARRRGPSRGRPGDTG